MRCIKTWAASLKSHSLGYLKEIGRSLTAAWFWRQITSQPWQLRETESCCRCFVWEGGWQWGFWVFVAVLLLLWRWHNFFFLSPVANFSSLSASPITAEREREKERIQNMELNCISISHRRKAAPLSDWPILNSCQHCGQRIVPARSPHPSWTAV